MTMKPSLDPSCVLALDFNELTGSTAYDISGNNNHGTIYGAQRTRGYLGRALSFDGVDDYIYVQDSDTLDLTDNISIIVLFKRSNTQPFSFAKNAAYVLRVYLSAIQWNIWTDEGTKTTATALDTTELNKWYFVASTIELTDAISKTHTIKTYLNGILTGSKSYTGSTVVNEVPINIARVPWSPYYYFGGLLSFIRVYNRALSASEVYEHYIYATEQLRRAGKPIFERLKR